MSENNRESSLTTPEDRDSVNKWKPDQFQPPLTNEESVEAIKTLNNTAFTEKFPKIDRTYADPAIALQNIGVISFVPAQGATPNSNGIFGFAKLRGNFASEMEANQRAEHLIRNVDSYHQIYHTYVGRPFPLTLSSKYSAETDVIDIRKEMTKSVSADIKDKKEEERKIIKEIKEKEEKLKEDTSREEVDPYDEYITLCVKKAQISWTYLEHFKKIAELKGIISKTRERLQELDVEYPDFRDKYFEKYMSARRESGIKDSKDDETNFISFMIEDKPLPYIDFTPENLFE